MDDKLREHILELLEGQFAHADIEATLKDFPLSKINERPAGSPHTPWELLGHMRVAQWDILEFSRDVEHVSPDFPAGYWNKVEASAEDWNESVEQILSDLEAMRELVRDKNVDLFAKIPHGDGQTILREALLVADHNAYHLGQLMLLRRMLENS